MLARLRSDLDRQIKQCPEFGDQDGLDQYILDLNTFYYESFHDHFMPRYRQAIEADMRRIHNLSRQEDSVRADLITLLRFLIRSFNLTKATMGQLHVQRGEMESQLLALQTSLETGSVDLLYLLKEHAEAWASFRTQLDVGRTISSDRQLLSSLEHSPVCSLAASLFRVWMPTSNKDKRDFNRLLAQWQLALKLLLKMQETQSPGKDWLTAQLNELEKIDAGWDNRKVPAPIRGWYKLNLQPTYQLYQEVLNGSAGRNDQRRVMRVASQFHDWLQAWLIVLERCLDYSSRGWDNWMDQIMSLLGRDEKYWLAWADYAQKSLHSIDELIVGLSNLRSASYKAFSVRSRQILTDTCQYLLQTIGEQPVSPLRAAAEKLRSEAGMTLQGIEIMAERETHIRTAMETYTAIRTAIGSDIDTLESTQRDLEKMLDKRVLADKFGDMDIKLDHIVIQTGAAFPSAYVHLLDRAPIETKASDAPAGNVIYQEGDIFIIRSGGRSYEVIPRIIVAGKG